jgi:cytoskeletal protein RodZ
LKLIQGENTMQKLTIGLVLIIFILLGVIGYIFASQNTQIMPNITLSNNSTNGSDYSSGSDSSYSKSKSTSSSSTKHVATNTTNKSGSSNSSNTNPTKPTKPITGNDTK